MIELETTTHQACSAPSDPIPTKMDGQCKNLFKFIKLDTQHHLLKIVLDPEKFQELCIDPLTDSYWKKRLSFLRKPGFFKKNNTHPVTKAPTEISRCSTRTILPQAQSRHPICPTLPPPRPEPYRRSPNTETPDLKKQPRLLTRAATPPSFLSKTISNPNLNELKTPTKNPSKIESSAHNPIIFKVLGSQAILIALTAGSYYFLSKRVDRQEEGAPTEDSSHSEENLETPDESAPASKESLDSPPEAVSETNENNNSTAPTSEVEESSPSSPVISPQTNLELPFSIEKPILPVPIKAKQTPQFCPISHDLLHRANNSIAPSSASLQNPTPLPTTAPQAAIPPIIPVIRTEQTPKQTPIPYSLLPWTGNSNAPVLGALQNPTYLPKATLEINTMAASPAPTKQPTYLLAPDSLAKGKAINSIIKDILVRFSKNSYPLQFPIDLTGKPICPAQMPKQISSDFPETSLQVWEGAQGEDSIYSFPAIPLAACALLALYFLMNNLSQENHPTFGKTSIDKSDEEEVSDDEDSVSQSDIENLQKFTDKMYQVKDDRKQLNECIYRETIDQFSPGTQQIIQRFTRQLHQELEELRSIPEDQRPKYRIKPDGHLEQIH